MKTSRPIPIKLSSELTEFAENLEPFGSMVIAANRVPSGMDDAAVKYSRDSLSDRKAYSHVAKV